MKGTLQEALDSAHIEFGTPFDEVGTKGNGKEHYSYTSVADDKAYPDAIKLTANTPNDWIDMTDAVPTDMDALCNTCNSEDCTNCGFAKEYHKAIIEPFDDSNDSYIKTLNKIG